jgi:hypothetical protein
MKKFHIQTLNNVKDICNLLNEEKFTEKIEVLSNSTIGQHIRHIIEFYSCLMLGYKSGVINYDKRERNTLIETIPTYAYTTLETIQTELAMADFNKNMEVVHEIDDTPYLIGTTFARELYYMAEHTLHHFALIKIGFEAAFPEIQLPANFGIASSTVKHHQEKTTCAS